MSALAGGTAIVRTWMIMFAVLGAAIAWAIHLVAMYPLVQVACDRGSSAVLHLVSMLTLVPAVTSGGMALVVARRLRALSARDPWVERSLFAARLGFCMSVVFTGLIVFEWLPAFFLDACP